MSTCSPSPFTEARFVGLPCHDHGSDHIPVVCDVALPREEGKSAILAGDFNMTPDSQLYNYMSSGGRMEPTGPHGYYSGKLHTDRGKLQFAHAGLYSDTLS